MTTPATASELLEFLEANQDVVIDRREIASPTFGTIRRSIRQIVVNLSESDDEETLRIVRELRAMLSEWLTAPVPFDSTIGESLVSVLGAPDTVQARWGRDIRQSYDMCRSAAPGLQLEDNPVRVQVRSVVGDLRNRQQRFKVYCHRRAVIYFQELLTAEHCEPLPAESFLNTLREYREANPFDVLIKVGPLRVRGWGAAPDAVVTSPRFKELIQIVWAGCNDDADFGYDPMANSNATESADETKPGQPRQSPYSRMNIRTRISKYGDDPGAIVNADIDQDELRVFKNLEQSTESRPATLIHVEDDHGILYPPHSRVLSFDFNPTAESPVMLRIPGESLVEGMYVIVPVMDDVDLGGLQAKHGHFSEIWKGRLKELYSADSGHLIMRLRAAGLDLINLPAAIRHWCSPPSTVIHAPQQVRHFEILMKVLEIDDDRGLSAAGHTLPFWQLAWNEVRRSRGEAIQAGFQEQEIVEEQLIHVLSQMVRDLRDRASKSAGFNLAIPPQHGIRGTFNFLRVEAVETGFRVPNAQFRIIHDLRTVDQWRD